MTQSLHASVSLVMCEDDYYLSRLRAVERAEAGTELDTRARVILQIMVLILELHVMVM